MKLARKDWIMLTKWHFMPLNACIVGIVVGMALTSSLIVLTSGLCLIPATTIAIGFSE